MNVIDFVIISGRAVAYPIYKYTYERSATSVTSSWPEPTRAYRTWVHQVTTDARRTLDYLETRPDIDSDKFGYYGFSWGARMSPIVLGLDHRLKLAILLSGGLGNGRPVPEADPFNFAPRVRVPVLMLNGDQDFIFPDSDLAAPAVPGPGNGCRPQATRPVSGWPRNYRDPARPDHPGSRSESWIAGWDGFSNAFDRTFP